MRDYYPDGDVGLITLYSYLGMRMIEDGVRSMGADVTRSGLARYLEGLNNYDAGGLTAPFTLGPKDHGSITGAQIVQAQPRRHLHPADQGLDLPRPAAQPARAGVDEHRPRLAVPAHRPRLRRPVRAARLRRRPRLPGQRLPPHRPRRRRHGQRPLLRRARPLDAGRPRHGPGRRHRRRPPPPALYLAVFARLENASMAAKVTVVGGLRRRAAGGRRLPAHQLRPALRRPARSGRCSPSRPASRSSARRSPPSSSPCRSSPSSSSRSCSTALHHTDLGLALRASSQNPTSASLAGLPGPAHHRRPPGPAPACSPASPACCRSRPRRSSCPTYLFAETVRGLAAALTGAFVDLKRTVLAAFVLGILEQELVGFSPPWNAMRGALELRPHHRGRHLRPVTPARAVRAGRGDVVIDQVLRAHPRARRTARRWRRRSRRPRRAARCGR